MVVGGAATTSETAGCPRVTVPVLSSRTVVSAPARSRASLLRKRMPASAPRPGADHDGGRCRQAEGAGTGDDEHGDHVENRLREAATPNGEPADQGDGGERDDGGHEYRGDAIRHRLNRRFARLSRFHQADYLREHGVSADALRLDDEPALLIDGAAEDLRADRFIDRQALAR